MRTTLHVDDEAEMPLKEQDGLVVFDIKQLPKITAEQVKRLAEECEVGNSARWERVGSHALAATRNESAARNWFQNHVVGNGGWATCALTEAGLVRVLSNPVVNQGT